jgi:hypothetical protein
LHAVHGARWFRVDNRHTLVPAFDGSVVAVPAGFGVPLPKDFVPLPHAASARPTAPAAALPRKRRRPHPSSLVVARS